ncbi:MAG: DUF1203 domain-containing protein [Bacteroidota bacterium]
MQQDFIISGIQHKEIEPLFQLNEQDLKARGISKIRVDEKPGYPCRVSLEDANLGEQVLAFNYEHHAVDTPYRASGPVFVRLEAPEAQLKKNEIPEMLEHRYLSLRVYNDAGMMIDARTLNGSELRAAIQELFKNKQAQYIQVHNAKPGCFNCEINRV